MGFRLMGVRRTKFRGQLEGRGDCGVVALTTITGAAYVDVWDWFLRIENRDGRWNGATYRENYARCARSFGVKITKIYRGLGLTLAEWTERVARDGETYLVCSCDHAGVLKDGVYTDTYGTSTLEYRVQPPRSFVTDVWVVT